MRKPLHTLVAAAAALIAHGLAAQRPPDNGPRTVHADWQVLVGATAVVRPGTSVPNATIVLKDGRIVSVTEAGPVPEGARRWDCAGLTVYAGFLEPWLPVTAPEVDPTLPGNHHNTKITPQRHALDGPGVDEATRSALHRAGFTAAALVPKGGILRGAGAVVHLVDPAIDDRPATLRARAFHGVGFDRRGGGYPGSEMGVIAALRQALLDADWHEKSLASRRLAPEQVPPIPPRRAAEALIDRQVPLWFETTNELQALRAGKIAAGFHRPAVLVGSGLEFRRLDALAALGLPVVLPVDFPLAPDVGTVAKAERVSLRDLLTWEQAPTNPFRVVQAGLKAALTTFGLDKADEFSGKVKLAIEHGLTADQALAMVTTTPAHLLGLEKELGTLESGRIANLVLAEGPLFGEGFEVHGVWIRGRYHETKTPEPATTGTWAMVVQLAAQSTATLTVSKDGVEVAREDTVTKAEKVVRKGRHLEFVLDGAVFGVAGRFTMTAHREGDTLFGNGTSPEGTPVRWVATPAPPGDDEVAEADEKGEHDAAPAAAKGPAPQERTLAVPLGAYGLEAVVDQVTAVFTGATIWTSGPMGRIVNGALFVKEGKIVFVGPIRNLPDTGSAPIVDLSGKQITPGIIDCHSHTGISGGINESRQTVTSEVRIGDVINPDAVDWYRQLAGGVTAVNQLHGSANPIGGQNNVVKVRWGVAHPDDMKLAGAPAGIKFALGENPRRVNRRGGDPNKRYPSTRMGVEAVIRDRFVSARDYDGEWQRYHALPPAERARTQPPRRDLELEAIAEILRGERLIHCHSYRQDEIFMLCRMADEFGFKLGTLQHVLEGYKVAEAIKKSALGASAFSDWWAYKLEVFDAIPENGAIMFEVGVPVSFNSDSNELARRLNTEAGKAVKYGGVPPEEALKFVTYNPALQLGVADRIGSLETGKDADFAVWSGNPLSYTSRCLATYVDGRPLFTIERDRELRNTAAAERQRLLQKALVEKKVAEPPTRRRFGFGRSRFWTVDETYSCCEQEERR